VVTGKKTCGCVLDCLLTIDLFFPRSSACVCVFSDAARICDRCYGWAPEVELIGQNEAANVNFVPTHLHHIVFELVKNSMRAVLEHHGVKNYDAPAIKIVLSEDEREFAIKISDQGGGIPRKDMPRIWSYLYTTQSNDANGGPGGPEALLDAIKDGGSGAGHPTNAVGPAGGEGAPMSGFGYGLPISKMSAESNPGHAMHALFLHLALRFAFNSRRLSSSAADSCVSASLSFLSPLSSCLPGTVLISAVTSTSCPWKATALTLTCTCPS
jgi:hypothetical protein